MVHAYLLRSGRARYFSHLMDGPVRDVTSKLSAHWIVGPLRLVERRRGCGLQPKHGEVARAHEAARLCDRQLPLPIQAQLTYSVPVTTRAEGFFINPIRQPAQLLFGAEDWLCLVLLHVRSKQEVE
jgi:hypothetical protein